MKTGICSRQRTAKQCRERYENLLAPELDKSEWTDREDAILLAAVSEFGSSNWRMVQERLTGRTDADCAKRWAKLEPVHIGERSLTHAARAVYFPGDRRKRKQTPALTEGDLSIPSMTAVQELLKAAVEKNNRRAGGGLVDGSVTASNPVTPVPSRKRGRPSTRRSDLMSDSVVSDETGRKKFRTRRFAVLTYFLQDLVTGKSQADRHLRVLKKHVISERAANLGVTAYKWKDFIEDELNPFMKQTIQTFRDQFCVGDFSLTADAKDLLPTTDQTPDAQQQQPEQDDDHDLLTEKIIYSQSLNPQERETITDLLKAFRVDLDDQP